ncbi:MAG: hypothetical protein C0624_00720 [Desulfuromonas sp.]|nr:MAG: hypothetical protein C0624_00720 [Desulfuromonas sp.]
MKVWQRLTICTALLLLSLGPAHNALAVSISGRSSTEIEWFDDAQGDTALPVYEYLLLNAKNLDGNGLNFQGYGRLSDDINDEVDAESRLYYAYLKKKNLFQNLDLKLGRQFVSTTAGASLMDGLHLDYNNLGPMKLSLFGGGDVSYDADYEADDLIVGGEVGGYFFKSLSLGLSYVQTWDKGDLAKELIGLDLDYDLHNTLNLYSEAQFDYLTDSLAYFLGGTSYHASDKLTLRAEYLYSLPVFSATSIYSVFAVSEYEELMAELTYRIATGLNAFGRITHEMYQDYADADVFEAGIEKIRTNNFSGYLSGVWREDKDNQDLKGFKVRGAYMLNQYIQAGIGAEVDVLQRRLEDDNDDTSSTRYWADLTTYLTRTVSLQGKVERIESALWSEYYRGRVRLNISF